jgi:hypothetical protein
MTDLSAVDPAIVSTSTKIPSSKATPSFPPSAVIIREDVEAALENFNWDTHVAIKSTEENSLVSIPRDSALKLPFVADKLKDAGKSPITLPFKASAIVAINHWIEKKGLGGKATVTFPKPLLHTDVAMITEDDWEKHFAHSVLLTSVQNCIVVLNAAEKLGLAHLQEFCIAALSCALRGRTETELCAAFGRVDPFTPEELSAVDVVYPWFPQITAAH